MYADPADRLWSGELRNSSCAIEAADSDNRLVGFPPPPENPNQYYADYDRENHLKKVLGHRSHRAM